MRQLILWFITTLAPSALTAQQAFKLHSDYDTIPVQSGKPVHKPLQGSNGSQYFFSYAYQFSAVTVIKTNEDGIVLWNKRLKASGTASDFIFTDYHDDILSLNTNSDTIYLIKFDSSGNEQWIKHLIKSPFFRVTNVLTTDDMRIVIAGNNMVNNNFATFSVYVCDSAGNFISGFEYTSSGPLGIESIRETDDGGFIITGFHNAEQFLLRTNPQGSSMWSHFYESGSGSYFKTFDAIETTSGDILTAGRFHSGPSYARPYIIKYNSNGAVQWLKYYLEEQKDDARNSLLKFSNGSMCMVTSTQSGAWWQRRRTFFYMDANGNATIQKQMQYYSHLAQAAIEVTMDDGFLQTLFHATGFPYHEFHKWHSTYNLCPVMDSYPITLSTLSNFSTVSGVINEFQDSLINTSSAVSPLIYLLPVSVNYVCGNTGSVGFNDGFEMIDTPLIYPNPAVDFIRINSIPGKEYDFVIYTIEGLYAGSYKISNDLAVPINKLSAGMYFYLLRSDGRFLKSGKFVKN